MRSSTSWSVLLCLTGLLNQPWAVADPFISAGSLPAANQTWTFDASDRCRILAHKSIEIQNNDHHLLVIQGGFGFARSTVNGVTTEIQDLNPFTVAFDLSKGFSTPELDPLWSYRIPLDSLQKLTITNHGGLWKSQDGNTIWYQGGHYYNADGYNTSYYHVNKSDIPEWQLWQLDVTAYQNGWKDVTNDTSGHELANRTFAGGAITVPNMKASFWVGGITDHTTSPTTPLDILQTSSQMLIYNETTHTITKQKYYNASSTDGYYQGGLIQLPIGSKNGYLMSLFSLEMPTATPWTDPDGENGNTESANPVSLGSIPLYDLETGQWIEQETAWFLDQVPAPRTRFCTALFHDKTDNTWNLWVHGGQLLSQQDQGVEDIYVLSMPSFIWSKVETTLPDTNLIRSHSCHAIGGQLVIVGGSPPSQFEPTNVTCDAEYIKVLTIGEDSISWSGSYSPNTEYKTPSVIRNVVSARTTPIAGFANAKLQSDFQVVQNAPKKNIGAIAGGVVGGLVILGVTGYLGCCWMRKRKSKQSSGGNSRVVADEGITPSTRNDYPEVTQVKETLYRTTTSELHESELSPVSTTRYSRPPLHELSAYTNGHS